MFLGFPTLNYIIFHFSLTRERGSEEQHPKMSSTEGLSNSESESSISSDVVVAEEIEYYNGNVNLPVYTKDRRVLKPQEVMNLLIKEKDFFNSKVCTTQPLQVQHHCTFIVDMRSLSNVKDIKCDDMGVWLNNSCHKLYYTVTNDESNIAIYPTKNKNGEDVVTLKREYFALKYETHNDVRKRIDTIQREYTVYILTDIFSYENLIKRSLSVLHYMLYIIYNNASWARLAVLIQNAGRPTRGNKNFLCVFFMWIG